MYDRLDGIKDACHAKVYGPAVSDVSWLIAEVERLRAERTDVIEELARRYGGMFASPGSEPSTTEIFREAQQLAQRRMRSAKDRCDPERNYHSSPHKGCILR